MSALQLLRAYLLGGCTSQCPNRPSVICVKRADGHSQHEARVGKKGWRVLWQ